MIFSNLFLFVVARFLGDSVAANFLQLERIVPNVMVHFILEIDVTSNQDLDFDFFKIFSWPRPAKKKEKKPPVRC